MFLDRITYTVGTDPGSVAVVDVNSESKPDIHFCHKSEFKERRCFPQETSIIYFYFCTSIALLASLVCFNRYKYIILPKLNFLVFQ
jgi:hypothetical protein